MDYLLRILRRQAVLLRVGDTPSQWNRGVAAGYYPRPVKLSPEPNSRAVGWFEHEIDALLQSRRDARDAAAASETPPAAPVKRGRGRPRKYTQPLLPSRRDAQDAPAAPETPLDEPVKGNRCRPRKHAQPRRT